MDSVELKTRKAEQSEATRAALVQAASELFGARGYDNTATEEIVQHARVTRGALYHHFRDKADVFRAVYEEVQREVIAKILEASVSGGPDWIGRLQEGFRAYLDFYME